ncbi:MAG: RNA methyltransferase [Syntrophomonadaceae bacterium]|nr:RNA methyltransferase [Syntrophomonadaceae bacterium]
MRKSKVYIALLHYPMYNKRKDVVTTSITNLDLHDIARAARTYDVDGFYVVHPSASQQKLITDILKYWQDGYGGQYNSDRKEAFNLVHMVDSLEKAAAMTARSTGQTVITVATDAHRYPNTISYSDLKTEIFNEDRVFLLLFGTGWGMTRELTESCDYILEPVDGAGDYNHLSVRSAVSIIMDRLLGEYWFKE